MTYPNRRALRLCLVDMNNGHANQAMRCFAVLIERFFAQVQARNPELSCELLTVQPRNLGELPPTDCDLYLSSGGPGGPYDHDGEPWLDAYKAWLDSLVDGNLKHGPSAPSLFGVCYTFELLVRHFAVSGMEMRGTRKFGVMPVYMTNDGMSHPLTAPFGDRLFAFEHRNWEAIDLDERRLRENGGRLLAQESRDGVSKGRALLAFEFAPGVEGTQFHPEADKPGVVAWVSKRDQAQAFIEAYSYVTYERMLKTLDNPQRIAKTFTLLLPGWLTRKFNHLAEVRGWRLLDAPTLDLPFFAADAPPAESMARPSLRPFAAAAAAKDGGDSIPKLKASSMHFDDADTIVDAAFLRPLEKELDPSVSDEGQSL